VNIEISVVICSHNQADYLHLCLKSLAGQTIPIEQFEIIVVDNASQDHTKDVILNFSDMQNLRYIYEPNLGLSNARNTGWQVAQSDLVAFLDSDAIASPDWLIQVKERFASNLHKPSAVGGKIAPIWEGKRPDWLCQDLETYIGIIDWSDTPFIIDDESPYYLAGSNLAYRTDVLQRAGGFNARLGRKGSKLLSNEEILLQKKLIYMNLSVYYDPNICVEHHIKPHCLKKKWFYKRFFWQGVSDVIVEYQVSLMKGNPWYTVSHIREDLARLFSEAKRYFKGWINRSAGSVASQSRVLYWIGRLLYNARILMGRT
jgi:glycosyltransferase involved in cell wall biosynthesis